MQQPIEGLSPSGPLTDVVGVHEVQRHDYLSAKQGGGIHGGRYVADHHFPRRGGVEAEPGLESLQVAEQIALLPLVPFDSGEPEAAGEIRLIQGGHPRGHENVGELGSGSRRGVEPVGAGPVLSQSVHLGSGERSQPGAQTGDPRLVEEGPSVSSGKEVDGGPSGPRSPGAAGARGSAGTTGQGTLINEPGVSEPVRRHVTALGEAPHMPVRDPEALGGLPHRQKSHARRVPESDLFMHAREP